MKICKSKRHGKPVWELDTDIIEGKRRRFFFQSEKAARLKFSEIKADFTAAGRRWTSATATEKATVIRVLDEIHGQGLTLKRVWNAYRSGSIAHAESGEKAFRCD